MTNAVDTRWIIFRVMYIYRKVPVLQGLYHAGATKCSHLHVHVRRVHIQCHGGHHGSWCLHVLPVPHAQNAPADFSVKVVGHPQELPSRIKDHLFIRKNVVQPLYEDPRSTERVDPTQNLSLHAWEQVHSLREFPGVRIPRKKISVFAPRIAYIHNIMYQ